MKKTLLASALLVGIHAYAEIPADLEARADLVQKQNDLATAHLNQAYQLFLQNHPYVDKIEIKSRDYTRNAGSATVKTVVEIDWNKDLLGDVDLPKELVFHNTIDYSDAVAKAGKLAVINGVLEADTLAEKLKIAKDSKEFATLVEVLKHIELQTVLLDDDKLEQYLRVKPVDANPEQGLHITYEGLESKTESTIGDLSLLAGKTTMTSGKFEITNNKPDNTHEPKKIIFNPFDVKGEFTKNGKMEYDVSPLELTIDDNILKVKSIDVRGKDLAFDPTLGTFLGEITYNIKDISHASASIPEAVYIDNMKFHLDNEKNRDELYSQQFNFEINPVSKSFDGLTGGMSEAVGVKSLVGKGELKNMSGTLVEALNNLPVDFQKMSIAASDPALQQAAQQAFEQRIDRILAEAGKHNASSKFNLTLNTKNGDAEIDSWIEILKGSALTYAAIKSAVDADTPDTFIKLLGDNVRFEVNVTLPKALTDAIGVSPMLESSAAGFLKLDGNNYKLVLKNDDKAITLNGEAFPPAM